MSNRSRRKAAEKVYAPHIVAIDGIRGGRPIVEGTRLQPEDIDAWWVPTAPLDFEDVFNEMAINEADREKVIAAIAFACGRRYERELGIEETRARLKQAIDDVLGGRSDG